MFMCTGLEPGADGVGDYCRRLAEELIKLGVECRVIALNDREIGSEVREQPSPSLGIWRLPERSPISARSARVAALLSDWEPDWVSLQFVCYGFQRKGLAHREATWLLTLLRGHPLHVMLHELWVGTEPHASTKNTILGWAQRLLVLRLLRRLKPRLTHTTNRRDQLILAKHGIASEVLALFGNIPVGAELAGRWLADAILANGGPDITRDRERLWLFGMFGSLSPNWPAADVLPRLSAIARGAGRHIVMVSGGHAGAHAEELVAHWRMLTPDIDFISIGPRSPLEISQFLNSVDFGLPTSPVYRLGKSSSFAAMVEHGLPVILGSDARGSHKSASDIPAGAVLWTDEVRLPERLSNAPARVRLPNQAAATAEAFLSTLQEAD